MDYLGFIEKKREETKKSIERFGFDRVGWRNIKKGGSHVYEREKATYMVQSNCPEKVFVLERLRLRENIGAIANKEAAVEGSLEYRIGYYMIGKNGRMNGRWTWGQFCPLIPSKDFSKLIRLAIKENTILEDIN